MFRNLNFTNMTNLLQLKKDAMKKFINSFDIIISDCNGVLWNKEPFPGVKETLHKLKKIGKKIHFVTNNSCQSLYIHQFETIGIDLQPNDLIHPTITLIDYLKDIKFEKKLFCVSSDIILSLLDETNINYCTLPNMCEEKVPELLLHIADDLNIGAIYIDMDINVNYIKILKSLNLLKRLDVLFLVGAQDTIIPLDSDSYLLGPGVFQNILSNFSGRQPIILGKPSKYLKNKIFEKFVISHPDRVLFIGDTLEVDMVFGNMCGFQKLLVLSGISTLKDIQENIETDKTPDFYLESFGDMNKILDNI